MKEKKGRNAELVARRAQGMTYRALAEYFNVSTTTAYRIVQRARARKEA